MYNGTEPLIKEEIDALLMANLQNYDLGTGKWLLVDQWLINEIGYDEIKINISDYLIQEMPTTTMPPPGQANYMYMNLIKKIRKRQQPGFLIIVLNKITFLNKLYIAIIVYKTKHY